MNAEARRSMLVALGLGVLVFVLYANALRNPFLIDDLDAIVSHPDVIEPGGILRMWGHDYWAGRSPEDRNLYRPITVLSYWLNARVTGLSPAGFRVVNMLLLAGLGWLVFMWITAWGAKSQAAIVAALVMLCHPVHTTVVNNIVGRADLLAMVGVVAFAVLQRRGRWTPLSITAAVIACVIALGSKETGLLIVAVAVVQGAKLKEAVIVGVPLLIYLAARIGVVGVLPHYGPAILDLTGNPLRGMSLVERLPAALSLAWVYLRETVWPTMRWSHVPDAVPTWSSGVTWAGVVVLVVVTCATTQAWRRKQEWALAATLLVLGNYLLIGNLFTPIGAYADYRLMLPCTLAAAMAVAAWRWSTYVGAVLCVVFSLVVVWHNTHWTSHVILMSDNYQRQPDNTRASFLFGVAWGEQNKPHKAIEFMAPAVERHPESREARTEYGKMLVAVGRFDEAIANYHALVQKHQQDAATMNQLAALMMVQGELAQAGAWLELAERIAPKNAAIMHNRAVLENNRGRLNDAVMAYESLLREHPDHAAGRAEYNELKQRMRESTP